MATTKKGDTTTSKTTRSSEDARAASSRTSPASKANGKAKTAPAAPAARKAAPVKLTDKQKVFLAQIHAAGESGYEPKNKNEQKSIDALVTRKVLKRGTKNKESGNYRYLLTKAGQAHLPTA